MYRKSLENLLCVHSDRHLVTLRIVMMTRSSEWLLTWSQSCSLGFSVWLCSDGFHWHLALHNPLESLDHQLLPGYQPVALLIFCTVLSISLSKDNNFALLDLRMKKSRVPKKGKRKLFEVIKTVLTGIDINTVNWHTVLNTSAKNLMVYF